MEREDGERMEGGGRREEGGGREGVRGRYHLLAQPSYPYARRRGGVFEWVEHVFVEV